MNPTRVFAAMAAIVLAIFGIFFLTRPDTVPPPTEPRTADFSLTDSEAIARLRELEALNSRAYERRDASLISEIYATESPLADKVRKEISDLRRDGISVRVTFDIKNVDVLTNSDDKVVLHETVLSDARFTDASGRDVTESGRPEIQEIRVTLHRNADQWLIFDSVITEARPVK